MDDSGLEPGTLVRFRYWNKIRSVGVVVGTLKLPDRFASYAVMFEGELRSVMGYNLIKVEDERE